jgi:phage regulator Rha-like protein
MHEIAYETLPIGQAGTFVLQERQRLDGEMAKLKAENRQLKQMLIVAWRFMQDESAEDANRMNTKAGWATTIARHLEALGVPVDCNAITLEPRCQPTVTKDLPTAANG